MHSTPAATRCSSAAAHRDFVERLDDLAARSDALAHAEAHGARREKHRGLRVEPDLVHPAPHLSANLEGVAESLGRDDSKTAALAFQHRVGRNRGAMRKLRDGPGFDPFVRGQPLDRGDGRVAGVPGGAWNLEHDGRPRPSRTHTMSVNVPPTSTPTRQLPCSLFTTICFLYD